MRALSRVPEACSVWGVFFDQMKETKAPVPGPWEGLCLSSDDHRPHLPPGPGPGRADPTGSPHTHGVACICSLQNRSNLGCPEGTLSAGQESGWWTKGGSAEKHCWATARAAQVASPCDLVPCSRSFSLPPSIWREKDCL